MSQTRHAHIMPVVGGPYWALREPHYSVVVTTPPQVEPLTLSEAKAHLRVGFADDDTYITTLIQTAREYVESYTRRALITQTLTLSLDGFPRQVSYDFARITHSITLPRPPAQSVSSIKYVDTDGTLQTLDPSKYQVDTKGMPARVSPAYGEIWPLTRPQTHNAVSVEYVAGYGNSGSSVPAGIKQAMLLMIGHWYENREEVLIGTISQVLARSVSSLLAQYVAEW